MGGRERDETRSYRQISAHWNPIAKVIYIVLLKSTCDPNREPIHNPDTLYSRLALFCKQMWSALLIMLRLLGTVMGWSACEVATFQLTWGSSVTEFHFTVMFVLRSSGWSQHIFLYECSVCVGCFRLLTLTTGACLAMFAFNKDKNVEVTNFTVMSPWERSAFSFSLRTQRTNIQSSPSLLMGKFKTTANTST